MCIYHNAYLRINLQSFVELYLIEWLQVHFAYSLNVQNTTHHNPSDSAHSINIGSAVGYSWSNYAQNRVNDKTRKIKLIGIKLCTSNWTNCKMSRKITENVSTFRFSYDDDRKYTLSEKLTDDGNAKLWQKCSSHRLCIYSTVLASSVAYSEIRQTFLTQCGDV